MFIVISGRTQKERAGPNFPHAAGNTQQLLLGNANAIKDELLVLFFCEEIDAGNQGIGAAEIWAWPFLIARNTLDNADRFKRFFKLLNLDRFIDKDALE